MSSTPQPLDMLLQASLFTMGSLMIRNVFTASKRKGRLPPTSVSPPVPARLMTTSSSRPARAEAYASVLESKVLWALSNGLVVAKGFSETPCMSTNRSNPNPPSSSPLPHSKNVNLPIVAPAPISLDPYRYPTAAFEKAVELAKPFNDLVHMISLDSEWLREALIQTGDNDVFTGRLLRIFETICKEGSKQKWCLGIHRSDYMLHERKGDDRSLLQVELNTIASSFGSLSTQVTKLQKIFSDAPESIPANEAINNICSGIAAAHKLFLSDVLGVSQEDCCEDVVVIMVVQDNEKNFSDQGIIVQTLLANHKIICRRETMAFIMDNSSIDAATGQLKVKGHLTSVVYYRAGYAPCDYLSEKEWAARLMIERSNAIKCPNIAYHLAGTKKIQQVLANPGILERFFDCSVEKNKALVSKLRSVFAGLYSLDTTSTNSNGKDDTVESNSRERLWSKCQNEIVEAAIKSPQNYVLKPQREGGNNNAYNDELATMLKTKSPVELSAYILMEKIFAPTQVAVLVRDGKASQVESICELGIYGVYLSCAASKAEMLEDDLESESELESTSASDAGSLTTTEKMKINSYGGYLLRVKSSSSDEGGVAAGYSVLSCPQLV